ncbi:MAG: lytic murein transglycosylase [Candidatus Jidaibacter sp.]|nr:lytic murein transglycosylase [Candidatus Jidaibacter sp.]
MNRTKHSISLKIQALVTSLLLLVCQPSFATCLYNDFEGWKDCFIKDKLSHRLNSVDIDTLRQASFIPKVIDFDKKQPEKKLTFAGYQKLINLPQKTIDARAFYLQHKSLIDSVSSEYGVEGSVIVALLTMESDLGKVQGNFNIIDSLATLSYEGRRQAFFEKELINALTISKIEGIDYDSFKGSWAGAMGQCQFMPSSFLAYAVDHDGDGVKDIWGSHEDALASAANYLASNGWKYGKTQINKLSSKDAAQIKADCSKNKTICKINENFNLIKLEDEDTISNFKSGTNFDVLMKWNRSKYFVIAVLKIANSIAD